MRKRAIVPICNNAPADVRRNEIWFELNVVLSMMKKWWKKLKKFYQKNQTYFCNFANFKNFLRKIRELFKNFQKFLKIWHFYHFLAYFWFFSHYLAYKHSNEIDCFLHSFVTFWKIYSNKKVVQNSKFKNIQKNCSKKKSFIF